MGYYTVDDFSSALFLFYVLCITFLEGTANESVFCISDGRFTVLMLELFNLRGQFISFSSTLFQ